MGYKDENIKHRQPFGMKPRFSCPNCNTGFDIPKIPFMISCKKCKKNVMGDDIVVNETK